MKQYTTALAILILYATNPCLAGPKRTRRVQKASALRKRSRRSNDENLFAAVQSRSLTNVLALLKDLHNPNITNDDGQSPLHIAAQYGYKQIMRALLAFGARACTVDNTRQSPLHYAAKGGHLAAISVLLKAYAELNATDIHGLTPLHSAIETGNNKIVAALISAGADINIAARNGDTPLCLAVHKNNHKATTLLLDAGANTNQEEHLSTAAIMNYTKIITALLEHGADPNKTSKSDTRSPLHSASQNGHVPSVRALLAHGANPNTTDMYGNTPLHGPAYNGYHKAITELLAHNADPNKMNKIEETPLHNAIQNNAIHASRILIEGGAELIPACKAMPLEYYSFSSHTETDQSPTFLQYLISHYISATAKNGDTVLHRLFRSRYSYNQKLLIKNILDHPDAALCDITKINEDGHNVLHVAAIHNPSLLARFFQQLFLSKPMHTQNIIRRTMTPSGDTLDSLATPEIRRLLGKANIAPHASWTPLMQAVHHTTIVDAASHEECKQLFRGHSSNLTHITSTFDSALSVAQCERVKALIREEIQRKASADAMVAFSKSTQK